MGFQAIRATTMFSVHVLLTVCAVATLCFASVSSSFLQWKHCNKCIPNKHLITIILICECALFDS